MEPDSWLINRFHRLPLCHPFHEHQATGRRGCGQRRRTAHPFSRPPSVASVYTLELRPAPALGRRLRPVAVPPQPHSRPCSIPPGSAAPSLFCACRYRAPLQHPGHGTRRTKPQPDLGGSSRYPPGALGLDNRAMARAISRACSRVRYSAFKASVRA